MTSPCPNYDPWDKDYLEGLDIDYEWDPDDEYWDIDYEILEECVS